MTDTELDALVKQAMDRAIERLQKLHSHAGRPAWDQVICEELSKPFTTLRAQLAEAKEAREKALREAAEILDEEGWLGMSKHRILALIEKPNAG